MICESLSVELVIKEGSIEAYTSPVIVQEVIELIAIYGMRQEATLLQP